MAGAGAVEWLTAPSGVESDHVEGDGGEHVLEVGFGQAAVAGMTCAGRGDGLVHGGFGAGPDGVPGPPVSVLCCALWAASWAWWSSRGGTVSCRPARLAVVHWPRTGHGAQVVVSNLMTIASVPRWVHELPDELILSCGQRACRASKSMSKLTRSNPASALACGEVSASSGLTSSTPKSRSAPATSATEGYPESR